MRLLLAKTNINRLNAVVHLILVVGRVIENSSFRSLGPPI